MISTVECTNASISHFISVYYTNTYLQVLAQHQLTQLLMLDLFLVLVLLSIYFRFQRVGVHTQDKQRILLYSAQSFLLH